MKYRLRLLVFSLILILAGCSSTAGTIETRLTDNNGVSVSVDCQALNASGRELLAARSLIFNSYDVSAVILPENRKVQGSVTVTLEKSYPGQTSLFFNLYPNAYRNDGGGITVSNVEVDGIPAEFEVTETILKALVPAGVEPGTEITLAFEVQLPHMAGRLGDDGETLLLAHWVPTLAHYQGGQWHIPGNCTLGDPYVNDAAVYKARIAIPGEYQLAGTGWHREQLQDSERIISIETGPVRDFTCLVSDSLKLWRQSTDQGVELRLYATEQLTDEDVVPYFELLGSALRFFSDAIGPYPYAQLSVICHDLNLLSGMEYANLIVLDTELGLGKLDSRSRHILIHELVHQWFYGVVGNDQYREAWLDEALAEYLSDVYLSQGQSAAERQRELWHIATVLGREAVETPLQQLNQFSSRKAYYDSVYRKSSLMFHALEQWLGWETIQEVLRSYYQEHAFAVASTQSFTETAEQVTGLRLQAFFSSWLCQGELPPLSPDTTRLQLTEDLVAQIVRLNAEDWCRQWAQAVVSQDRQAIASLADITREQALPLSSEYTLKKCVGYSYSIAVGSGYQVADVFFYIEVQDSLEQEQQALLSHRIILRQTDKGIEVAAFEAKLTFPEDSLPRMLAERFGSIGYCLEQQDAELVLPLIHPDSLASIANNLKQDFNWDRPGWDEIVLGRNREIDAEKRIVSYQLKVLYTKGNTTEIALLTWQFTVADFNGKWYITAYQHFEH